MKVIGDELLNGIEPCAATIGFFDGVHKGHQFLISQLKKVAQERGIVSAIITFPVHPRKVLNDEYQPQSISTKEEKIRLIEKSGVDYCILLPFTRDIASLSAFDFMKLLKEKYMVTALIIGYDHRFGHNRLEGFEEYCKYGKEIGIEVIQATELDNAELAVSSSAIRKLLISSDMAKANNLLGYRYSISGKVIDGYKIGRKLGYPTANISLLDDDKIIPGKGVYAVYVYTDGTKRGGMLNIGTRPTLDNGEHKSIEVNIFNFSGDLYRKIIEIEFIEFMRKEEKFDSMEELIQQIDKDKEEALQILKDNI